MASASSTPRVAALSTGTGSPRNTIMPSPVKRSSVASCSSTRRPIAAWNEPSVRMSSSGSVVSANAVKPRKSQ